MTTAAELLKEIEAERDQAVERYAKATALAADLRSENERLLLSNQRYANDDTYTRAARAESALAASLAREARMREALTGLLNHVDLNTCEHEETKRGGAIWTICCNCGQQWADDEGGFKPYTDPPPVASARTALEGLAEGEKPT
jgi:hypothetical protein